MPKSRDNTPAPSASPVAAGPDIDPALTAALARLAASTTLLVATDFDGTISPIVPHPADARPDPACMQALQRLAALPGTHAALISGRSLGDLADRVGSPPGVHLIGSHGGETSCDFAASLPAAAVALRDTLRVELSDLAAASPGCAVEVKPASVAFHFRNASPDVAAAAVDRVMQGPAARPGVHVKHGKMVVELAVVAASKGEAVDILRRRVGATAVVFLGDDVTDEDAFAALHPHDLGIKVGLEGASAASHRVLDTHAVALVLNTLADRRAAAEPALAATPIEHHTLLSDQRTAALLSPTGDLAWFCTPRIDSPALFAGLLGGPEAGAFTITPAGPAPATQPTQHYTGDAFTVQTRWPAFTITDWLDCSAGRTHEHAGRTDLIRRIQGRGRVRIRFAPRPDFGRSPARLDAHPAGLILTGRSDPIVLYAPGVAWQITHDGRHHAASADVDLDALGGDLTLELRCGTPSLEPSPAPVHDRQRDTDRHWSQWAEALALPTVAPDLVKRSALVLRALAHAPTGAIAAAPTTSLPECLGGERNWDYRYCWHRDAALAASALVRLGVTHEPLRFLEWLLGVADGLPSVAALAPIYTVGGGPLPPEAEITELPGYAASRPVRVGNAADRQLQLDVFAPIVEAAYLLTTRGVPLSTRHLALIDRIVDAVAERWHEPDHGIWEIRGPARHHVQSKAMCWQAVDLACKVRASRPAPAPTPAPAEWLALKDRIAADILTHGWNDNARAFTSAYGSTDLDAGCLLIGLVGLLPPTDPRFLSTVHAVEKALRVGNTVYRYRMNDGLPGEEGGFNICTTWLIQAYARCGRGNDARQLFSAYCQLPGPTGLIAEEFDPHSRRALGNFPQAYSHLGLINAALDIANLD